MPWSLARTKTNGLKVATHFLTCMCVHVCVTLPRPQTGFCQSGYMGGDTAADRRTRHRRLFREQQECCDPQRNVRWMVSTLISWRFVYTSTCKRTGHTWRRLEAFIFPPDVTERWDSAVAGMCLFSAISLFCRCKVAEGRLTRNKPPAVKNQIKAEADESLMMISCFLLSADGAAGALRGPLQPHLPLRSHHLFQLSAQAALQELLLLLPTTHLQVEGSEAALLWGDSHYGHVQIHPRLQLWGVQLSRRQILPWPSRLSHIFPQRFPEWLIDEENAAEILA